MDINCPVKKYPVGNKSNNGQRPGSGWSDELGLAKGSKEYAFLPNAEYQVGNYGYKTDPHHRRVKQAFGTLKNEKADRHKPQQRAVGKLARETGDQGGHLFASRFGGTGQAINMVPMATCINQKGGDWYNMEETLAKHITEGCTVSVVIDIFYMADYPLRPSSFVVTATVDGLTKKLFTIENPW